MTCGYVSWSCDVVDMLVRGALTNSCCVCRYSRNVDDNIITRGAKLDEAMERLTNWNVIMKTIKLFYRVSYLTFVAFTRLWWFQIDGMQQDIATRGMNP